MAHASGNIESSTQGMYNALARFIHWMLRCCTSGWRRTVSYYVVAIVTVGLGTALRIGLDPVLGEHHAIATKAAERMDGRVGVESGLNQGSRFWIELSRAQDDGLGRHLEKAPAELVVTV